MDYRPAASSSSRLAACLATTNLDHGALASRTACLDSDFLDN